jgi:very-short-patch-repair endonuclease
MRTPLKPGTIGRARNLRTHATDAERKLWYKLRELKALGYHFRRQVPFRSYILDFVEHSAKFVIELDGGSMGKTSTVSATKYAIARFDPKVTV